MLEYVSGTDICRSVYMLKYFGQEKTSDCGKCDVCRAKKASGDSTSDSTADEPTDAQSLLMDFINNEKQGKYTLTDIQKRFLLPGSPFVSEQLLTLLRNLIDEGQVPMYSN